MPLPLRLRNSELRGLIYVAPSKIHGKGVFARQELSKGEYIGTYHGPVARRNGTYVLWVYEQDDDENAIGCSGKNLLRYLNHKIPGNAEFDGFDLYARVTIRPDEEITFDYGAEWPVSG
ncbi:SET domain-containing protein [Sedimenticola selenatireducens]|uniref:SET domain-containing protein-lysine N-methyltransferase n=1 Tax=Sedimenticola selenatireducens TaxID=191960 RepID=A0A2N6CYQ3_9GAMM|nr:SET domain-containing protein-lysine N-methyltransferase [Sedimenticola selenatireducens]PLX62461.1 MAG: SET domain-containing protein-lysine N-methyltransferase [Sedimenticola selenatireducens]